MISIRELTGSELGSIHFLLIGSTTKCFNNWASHFHMMVKEAI